MHRSPRRLATAALAILTAASLSTVASAPASADDPQSVYAQLGQYNFTVPEFVTTVGIQLVGSGGRGGNGGVGTLVIGGNGGGGGGGAAAASCILHTHEGDTIVIALTATSATVQHEGVKAAEATNGGAATGQPGGAGAVMLAPNCIGDLPLTINGGNGVAGAAGTLIAGGAGGAGGMSTPPSECAADAGRGGTGGAGGLVGAGAQGLAGRVGCVVLTW